MTRRIMHLLTIACSSLEREGLIILPSEGEAGLHRGPLHLSAWSFNFVARFSTADNMAEAISLTFLAPKRNTWAPS